MYLSLSVLSVSLLAARTALGKLYTEPSHLRSTTYDYVIVGGMLMLPLLLFPAMLTYMASFSWNRRQRAREPPHRRSEDQSSRRRGWEKVLDLTFTSMALKNSSGSV